MDTPTNTHDNTPEQTATQPSHSHRFHFGYLVVFTLILISFIPLSLGLSCAGIFYPPLSDQLHVGTGTLSYFTSILWVGALVFLHPLGNLLGKVDARYCVTGGCVVAAADFLWLSNVSALWQFFVGAFVMGAVVAMLMFLSPSTLINRWFAKREGFYIGLVMAFTGIGGVVFSSVGGMLIQNIGWSRTYLVFACLCVITIPFAWFWIRSFPSDKGLLPVGQEANLSQNDSTDKNGLDNAPAHQELPGITAREALRSPLLYLLMAMTTLLNFGMYAYFVLPSYVNSLPVGIAMPMLGATAGSVAMAGQTIAKLALGAFGQSRPGVGSIASICLGIIGVVIFITSPGAILIYIGAFCYGFFYGVTNVMMPILTRKGFGLREYPQIYSKVSMAASLAGAATGFVWGTVREITGTFLTVFGGIIVVMIVCIGVVVAICMCLKKRSFQ